MPGRKKPSALLRVKKLSTENELRSCEVAGEDTLHAGEKPPEADSDVPPSLHRREHILVQQARVMSRQRSTTTY